MLPAKRVLVSSQPGELDAFGIAHALVLTNS